MEENILQYLAGKDDQARIFLTAYKNPGISTSEISKLLGKDLPQTGRDSTALTKKGLLKRKIVATEGKGSGKKTYTASFLPFFDGILPKTKNLRSEERKTIDEYFYLPSVKNTILKEIDLLFTPERISELKGKGASAIFNSLLPELMKIISAFFRINNQDIPQNIKEKMVLIIKKIDPYTP